MLGYVELTNEQRRQMIDTTQTFEALRPASVELASMGTMRVQKTNGEPYAYEVHGKVRKSQGRATPELMKRVEAHKARRKSLQGRVRTIGNRLEKMAPVNRALGLGTMRGIVARIIKEIDKEGLLGEHVIIGGTNAMHAYEAACGVQIGQEHVATTDADLVWDGSHNLFLAATGVKREGLMGILRRVDKSFVADYGFNATNRDGFIVDLICPEPGDDPRMREDGDIEATPMAGVNWLLDSPKFERVVIADDGMPVRMVVPEPRTFALHKLWVSTRPDRSPTKRPRDVAHAALTAELASKYLGLKFASKDMPWLPPALRGLLKDVAKLPKSQS
jgi:hypothetical protein